jgi:hypothetical protein
MLDRPAIEKNAKNYWTESGSSLRPCKSNLIFCGRGRAVVLIVVFGSTQRPSTQSAGTGANSGPFQSTTGLVANDSAHHRSSGSAEHGTSFFTS